MRSHRAILFRKVRRFVLVGIPHCGGETLASQAGPHAYLPCRITGISAARKPSRIYREQASELQTSEYRTQSPAQIRTWAGAPIFDPMPSRRTRFALPKSNSASAPYLVQ